MPKPRCFFCSYDCHERGKLSLCVHRKFETVVHNASELCGPYNSVAVPPLRQCFSASLDCGETYSEVLVHPKFPSQTLNRINRTRAVDVLIVELKQGSERLISNSDEDMELTTYCYLERALSTELKLQLRYNKTAGGLTLWVGNPGRASWPPRCVGGRIDDADGDPGALRVVTPTGGDALPVVWCYAKDILIGSGVHSNRVLHPDIAPTICSNTNTTEGPPPGTSVNGQASCLRCLQEAVSICISFEDCREMWRHCGSERCNDISDSFFKAAERVMRENPGKYSNCTIDPECKEKAIWLMTEGESDCNGDGVVDCDDRFARFFDSTCYTGVGEDMRLMETSSTFWNCRHYRKADIVDLKRGNMTARYFCMNQAYGKRHWEGPTFINYTTAFAVSRLFEPEDMPEKEALAAFKELRRLKEENRRLGKGELQDALVNVRNLLQLDERSLRKAQTAANATSLPELLGDIMTLVSPEVNATQDNVAVSKTSSIGVQLLSDDPSRGTKRRFGPSPRQIPIITRNEIVENENKIETAVILSKLAENVTLVVTTFADGADFISAGDIWNIENRREEFTVSDGRPDYATNFSIISKNKTEVQFPQASPNRDPSPFDCGCLNSHVVGVGLLKNRTYVPLRDGNTVNITFRTTVALLPGQQKHCVYWRHKEGRWATDGCRLVVDARGLGGLDTCECDHLTHFAQLVTDGVVTTGTHAHVLHVLTICACALSLLGLTGIISTGVFGKKWRKKRENKVLMNLAVATSLTMVIFLWTSSWQRPPGTSWCRVPDVLCRLLGGALHYFVLAGFSWMLVAAYTHYVRITSMLGLADFSHFLLKASLVGWGAPVLPVAVLVGIDPDAYAGKTREFCYPSGAGFYAAVLAPIFLVLFINFVMFILILRRLFPNACAVKNVGSELARWTNEQRLQTRMILICTAFTFLFGLTWFLGLISYSVVPAYIFCAAVAVQGPALFLFFVLGEESVRNKLKSIRNRMASPKQGNTSVSHVSTSNDISAPPNVSADVSQEKSTLPAEKLGKEHDLEEPHFRKGRFRETPL